MAANNRQAGSQTGGEKAEVWDKFYQLESVFVVLRSLDNVLFKVPLCDLTRQSTFFQNMSEMIPTTHEKIDIDLSGKLLRLLLDLLRNSGQIATRSISDILTLTECFDLLESTVKYDMDAITRIILQFPLINVRDAHPHWSNLLQATRRSSSAVFKALLPHTQVYNHLKHACVWSYLEEMDVGYRIPLLQAMFGATIIPLHGPHTIVDQHPSYNQSAFGSLGYVSKPWMLDFEPLQTTMALHAIGTGGVKRGADSNLVEEEDEAKVSVAQGRGKRRQTKKA